MKYCTDVVQGGITVVDIYSEWSGPCTAMQTALKKIKLEVNRDVDVDFDNDCLYWQNIKENRNPDCAQEDQIGGE